MASADGSRLAPCRLFSRDVTLLDNIVTTHNVGNVIIVTDLAPDDLIAIAMLMPDLCAFSKVACVHILVEGWGNNYRKAALLNSYFDSHEEQLNQKKVRIFVFYNKNDQTENYLNPDALHDRAPKRVSDIYDYPSVFWPCDDNEKQTTLIIALAPAFFLAYYKPSYWENSVLCMYGARNIVNTLRKSKVPFKDDDFLKALDNFRCVILYESYHVYGVLSNAVKSVDLSKVSHIRALTMEWNTREFYKQQAIVEKYKGSLTDGPRYLEAKKLLHELRDAPHMFFHSDTGLATFLLLPYKNLSTNYIPNAANYLFHAKITIDPVTKYTSYKTGAKTIRDNKIEKICVVSASFPENMDLRKLQLDMIEFFFRDHGKVGE